MLHLKNIGILSSYNSATDSFNSLKNCSIDIEDKIVTNIGSSNNNGDFIIDCNQKLVTPGFVDAHTHPVFTNGREKEFTQRVSGKSYEEISLSGGGINSSIKGVREYGRLTNGKLKGHLFVTWKPVSCTRDLPYIGISKAAIASMSGVCQGLGGTF